MTSYNAEVGLQFGVIQTAEPCSCTSNTTTELRPKALGEVMSGLDWGWVRLGDSEKGLFGLSE